VKARPWVRAASTNMRQRLLMLLLGLRMAAVAGWALASTTALMLPSIFRPHPPCLRRARAAPLPPAVLAASSSSGAGEPEEQGPPLAGEEQLRWCCSPARAASARVQSCGRAACMPQAHARTHAAACVRACARACLLCGAGGTVAPTASRILVFKQALEEQHLEVRKKARTVSIVPRAASHAASHALGAAKFSNFCSALAAHYSHNRSVSCSACILAANQAACVLFCAK